jgi:hypothetical protein
MPRSVHIGSILVAAFGAALLLEAWWIGVGPRWFEAARFWEELHTPAALRGLAGSAVGFFVLAWGLRRGFRWAWLAAMTWIIAWTGMVTALLFVFVFGTTAQSESLIIKFVREHPLESLLGGISAGALYGSLLYLGRKDARVFFRPDL